MQIVTYQSVDRPIATPLTLRDFEDLHRVLTHKRFIGDKKGVGLWSPVEYIPGTHSRNDENIHRLHAAVLDIDDFDRRDYERVTMPVLAKYSHIAHSTHTHADAMLRGQVRLRLVLELSRPVLAGDWKPLWAKLCALLGLTHKTKANPHGADAASATPSLAYYWPTSPPGREDWAYFARGSGDPIDVERLAKRSLQALEKPRCTVQNLHKLATKLKTGSMAGAQELGTALTALAEGGPFADQGGRDSMAWKLANRVITKCTGSDENEISELFRRSVDQMALRDGASALAYGVVEEKVARICAERDSQGAATEKPSDEDIDGRLNERHKLCLGRSGRDEYTQEEIDQLLEGVGVGRLDDVWIVQRGVGYYLLGWADGAWYYGPFSSSELPERAEVQLAPAKTAGVEVQILKAKKVARMSAPDLIANYGRVVDDIARSLYDQRPYLSKEKRKTTLVLAACPLVDHVPEYNEGVEKWLELLGGEDVEWLLDWIACVTLLEKPSQALFLQGAPGCGKTLLAEGLARLWYDGSPTALDDCLSRFNDILATCPLVFGDERIPTDTKGRPLIDELKDQISSHNRRYEAKYEKTSLLRGAIRIILAANNMRLFDLSAELTPEDISALLERLIHIRPSAGAATLLHGTHAATLGHWVEGGAIARHALWLRDNRKVRPGKRFMIRQAPNKRLRSIVANTGFRATVCHWLVLWLTRTNEVLPEAPIAVREGAIEASAAGLASNWEQYGEKVACAKPPRLFKVQEALSMLSAGFVQRKVQGHEVSVARIDTTILTEWASTAGSGLPSAKDIEGKIEALSRP